MESYIHRVHYYETDKMGIVHHSNYIRWMEEARVCFLDNIGFGYAWLESQGLVSPVVGVECRYLHPSVFDDKIAIDVSVEEFKGVRLVIAYSMKNARTGDTVMEGKSMHCFTDKAGKPIILKKQFPEFAERLKELAEGK